MIPTNDNFATHFETLGLDEQTLALAHGATIVPPALLAAPEPIDALRTLPRIGTRSEPGRIADLEVLGTLGEGGMGLVRLARQVALNRDVAVKTLRNVSDHAAPKLLQEAYVTGRLEHPNIVPIYTLGRDDDGAPLIVMKRIEGVSWLEVLRDPSTAPTDEVDLLWHLDVLLDLCNAVRFAHRHDVIHRDIKPENVMIGLFGEVYLLDWGIALSIASERVDDDALPHREDVFGMAGTPAYMAPEMTNDRALEHDARTDIYLLGAVLHELLVGAPRHSGATMFDVLRSCFENHTVEYPPDVPAELGAIANRAMATEREDRFQTVEAFRAAIVDFIEHRGALELIAEAEHLLEHVDDVADDDVDAFALHDRFIECRFACQQALRLWPESEHALEVFHRYLRARFAYAIERRDVVQARGLIAQFETEGLDVTVATQRLEGLEAERESEKEELRGLRALAAELDLSKGRLSRSAAALWMGFLWSAHVFYNAWARYGDPNLDHSSSLIRSTVIVVGIGVAGLFLFRNALFRTTTANRRLGFLFVVVVIALTAFRVVFALHPTDPLAARAFETAMYGVIAMTAGIIVDDLRISIVGTLYIPAALAEAWLGTNFLVGFVHLFVFGAAAWFWTPRQLEKRISV